MNQLVSEKFNSIKSSGPGKGWAKVIYCCFFIAVFLKMFIFSWDIDWKSKYRLFNVPANSYPGGDARNIQTTAYCVRHGFPYFGVNDCMLSATTVRLAHPDASVPPLNYPSLWVKAYALFNNDTEGFFRLFWISNAILLMVAIASLAFAINHKILPFILFSPITLLTIERGNIDGITFFFTFLPFLIFASDRVYGFFIGFATALKIFPFFGYLAFLKRRPPFISKNIIIGGILALPLIIPSLMETRELLDGTSYTSKIFNNAYGLTSVLYAPYLSEHEALAYALITGLVLVTMSGVAWAWKNQAWRQETESDLNNLGPKELSLLAVSLCIFLLTDIFFTNWAYRLIYLIPALCVLSNTKSTISRAMYGNMIAILWLPMFPFGWYLQNLACFTLAPLAIFLMLAIYSRQSESPPDYAGMTKP